MKTIAAVLLLSLGCVPSPSQTSATFQHPCTPTATYLREGAPWWTDSNWWVVIIAGFTGIAVAWQSKETRRAALAANKQIEINKTKERPKLLIEVEDLHPQSGRVPQTILRVTNVGLSTAFLGVAVCQLRLLASEDLPPSANDYTQLSISDSRLGPEEWKSDMVSLPFHKREGYESDKLVHLHGFIIFRDHFEDVRLKNFHYIWREFGVSVWMPHLERQAKGQWESREDQTEKKIGLPLPWWRRVYVAWKRLEGWAEALANLEETRY